VIFGVDVTPWILPAALTAGGMVLGILWETLGLRTLRKRARQTRWTWDDVVLDSVRGVGFVWLVAAGLYAALLSVPLGAEAKSVVREILAASVFLSFTIVAARAAGQGVEVWARHTTGGVPSSSLLKNLARLLVLAFGLFLILQNLGVQVTALVTGLGIGGLAVALALQDTLSNLFSGFQIILARQVRSGDFVQLDSGEEGYVTDIQWRNTTIRSRIDDHEIIVPNSKLANTIVTNFARPVRAFWVKVEVGVAYGSDLDRVEEVTLEVARQVLEEEGVSSGADPVLRYTGFGDSSIGFVVRMKLDEWGRQFQVRHAFIKRLHARYAEEGIDIPFPIRTVYVPKGVRVEARDDPTAGAGGPGRD
jgi:small-conductance mechanosensitive channel